MTFFISNGEDDTYILHYTTFFSIYRLSGIHCAKPFFKIRPGARVFYQIKKIVPMAHGTIYGPES